jgi:hypothetical protein
MPALLESVHPSFMLARGLRVLEEQSMLRAPARARRSEDAAYEFYVGVAKVLQETLGVVTTEALFVETDRALDDSLAKAVPLQAKHEQYQRFTRERELLNVKRKTIFDDERANPALLFARPVETPMRTVYLNAALRPTL